VGFSLLWVGSFCFGWVPLVVGGFLLLWVGSFCCVWVPFVVGGFPLLWVGSFCCGWVPFVVGEFLLLWMGSFTPPPSGAWNDGAYSTRSHPSTAPAHHLIQMYQATIDLARQTPTHRAQLIAHSHVMERRCARTRCTLWLLLPTVFLVAATPRAATCYLQATDVTSR
jgi:hypothetical protein